MRAIEWQMAAKKPGTGNLPVHGAASLTAAQTKAQRIADGKTAALEAH